MTRDALFTLLQQSFDTPKCLEILSGIWENDRWFDFKSFEKTAHYCKKVMEEMGLSEVEMLPLQADGKTVYGDWEMPRAWDVNAATLTLADTGEVLADYKKVPPSLVMYSAPTPPGGIKAQVFDADSIDEANCDALIATLSGAILFTSKSANSAVSLAKKVNAAGIISDFIPLFKDVRDDPMDLAGHSRWDNTFCAPLNDTGLFAFDLSPENGKYLRELMQKGDVFLHASVDTTFRDGINYVISGAIPGETAEEVLTYGHLYEPGALDNASGCAVILSLAGCLNRCIKKGLLPKPKRTLRFAVGWECTGSTAWLIAHPQRQKNTIAGLVVDMVGTEAIDNTYMRIWHNPLSNYGFTDALAKELVKAQQKHLDVDYPIKHRGFGIATDNVMCDTYWQIPTISFLTDTAKSYHSSLDTPDRIDPAIITREAVLIGTFMWETATMPPEEKTRLDNLARAQIATEKPKLAELLADEPAAFNNKIPRRLFPGCLTGASNPALSDSKWPLAWNTSLHLPLFWMDGKRNTAQIIQLAAAEQEIDDLAAYEAEMTEFFNFMADKGFITFN